MKWGKSVSAALLAVALALAGCSAAKEDSASTAVANESEALAPGSVNFSMADQSGSLQNAKTTVSADKNSKSEGAAQQSGTGSKEGESASQTSTQFSGMGTDQEGLNRKLIYKANLTMKVKNYSEAQSEIRNLVTLSGGYILQFSENSSSREEGGNFVLKIPSTGFSSFLKDLEKIPNESIQRNVQAQDLSEEYVDLEARLKAKQVVEARYLEFMQKATQTDDLVKYTNELAKIQEAIEQMKGRMRYIDQNVAFSTIEIRLYQPGSSLDINPKSESVFGRSRDAMLTSMGFLAGLGQGLVVLAAGLLPVLAIAFLIATPLWFWHRKSREARHKRAEEYNRRMQEQNRNLMPPHNPLSTAAKAEGQEDKDPNRQDEQ